MTAFRKSVRGIALAVAAASLLFLAVKYSVAGVQHIATWPAFISLQQEVHQELNRYHGKHRRFPDSLEELPINYARTKRATPEMLHDFSYRATQGGYELSWQRGLLKGSISVVSQAPTGP